MALKFISAWSKKNDSKISIGNCYVVGGKKVHIEWDRVSGRISYWQDDREKSVKLSVTILEEEVGPKFLHHRIISMVKAHYAFSLRKR